MEKAHQCGICQAPCRLKCSKCKAVYYCSQDHQKQDWPAHKTVCQPAPGPGPAPEPKAPTDSIVCQPAPNTTTGPCVPSPVGGLCTRCQGPLTGQCKVPHPRQLLEDGGGFFGGGETRQNYSCGACNQFFSQVTKLSDKSMSYKPAKAEWCFIGKHTTNPLKADDKRRIEKDVLSLQWSNNLQKEIDAIPTNLPNVRILRIEKTEFYESKSKIRINVSMPKLERVQLIDISFSQIHFNEQLTPNLRDVFLQNVPDECDIQVVLPKLARFEIHYYGPPEDDSWVHTMLNTATQLEYFSSYKFRVHPSLTFASNKLTYIRLHRAECLQNVSVWAPNLEVLDLQAAYDVDKVNILQNHPLASSLPPGHKKSRFHLNLLNTTIEGAELEKLRKHPRVKDIRLPEEEDDSN